MTKTCAYCEYFDGGGLSIVNLVRQDPNKVSINGDCHNSLSPRFTVESDFSCAYFALDSLLFPENQSLLSSLF